MLFPGLWGRKVERGLSLFHEYLVVFAAIFLGIFSENRFRFHGNGPLKVVFYVMLLRKNVISLKLSGIFRFCKRHIKQE